MGARQITVMDQILGEIGKAINTLAAPAQAGRAPPAAAGGELVLNAAEQTESGRLMRVNHAGEVAAQALYRGQALTARDAGAEAALRQAAAEETDHLAWCETRIAELGGRTSLLNPVWYAGSFMIGALAGALGDRTSLGFVSETERQVESHLRGHLDRLPAADHRSRAILEQMKQDEERHGASAAALGGAELPAWVRVAMRLTSRLMTRGSYWL
jgi:3-demethoxyubiquinol 3-hydroxylase